MRDVGEMGESAFRGWCSSGGITANKSRIDRTGWDFFVDFPFQPDDSQPKDMWPPPIECKIQVKSTDKREKKLQVKVSNLNRSIRAQMPAFYCFIEFDGLENAQAAYLVHVGKDIIEKTLKRIRELEVKGKADQLNKRTITIHYGDDQKLDKLSGASIKSEIEKHVPHGMERYVEEKNKLLKTLGFDEGAGQFTFTVSGEQPIEKMVDLTLGIREEVKVSRLVGYHKRFSILSNEPFVDSKGGKISLTTKPVRKATVTFKEYDFSPSISFDASLYLSPFRQSIPKKYIKFRIEADFFDVTFEPYNGKAKISFSIDNNTEYSLRNIKNMLKALTLFRKSKDGVIFGTEPEELPPFSIKIKINEDVADYSALYEISEEAGELCAFFELPEGTPVSVECLLRYGKNIKGFHRIIKSDPKLFKVDFEQENLEFEGYEKVACIFLVSTPIGSHLVGCFVAFIGIPYSLETNKLALAPTDKQIGPKFVAKTDDTIDQVKIDQEFEKFSELLMKKNFFPIRIKK